MTRLYKMKKKVFPLLACSIFFLFSCSCSNSGAFTSGTPSGITTTSYPYIPEPENVDPFSLIGASGATYSQEGNIFTITSGGLFTANGLLEEGQIIVAANSNEKVELDLANATITNSNDSPIKAISAKSFEVKAKDGSVNLIKDRRPVKTYDSTAVGEGAINSKIDLSFTGKGTLLVKGSYNSGVHSTNDVDLKNLTLQVEGVNNAIKGKDSIVVDSGIIYAYSSLGNGLKTENSDISSANSQRGIIAVNGGTLFINCLGDALSAAYNIEINQKDQIVPTTIDLYTGKNSNYSSLYVEGSSAKGFKAANAINIYDGTMTLSSGDDAFHADYGATLQNGATGLGNINIAGGNVNVASGDDAIHADNTISISGGKIEITDSNEGLEANHISISGGQTYIYGSDDGINASYKINQLPSIEISGGFIDIAVNGQDVDGIDSNGTFAQSGGVVISRGSPFDNSGMSTALDVDGIATISGGTFIAFNGTETSPTKGEGVLFAGTSNPGSHQPNPPHLKQAGDSNRSFESGSYLLSGDNLSISFVNTYQYSSFMVYSNSIVSGSSYVLSKDGSIVLSWNQSSSDVIIS